jgi:tetratricopeptide (TPR) repeat protein
MRHVPVSAILAAGLLSLPGAGPVTDMTKNLLAVCSDPNTPPAEARGACLRAVMRGRLDAKNRALAWLNAGIAAYALERYRDAASAQTSAIEANPGLAAAYENRALAYDKLDKVNKALADYASAISIEPRAPGPYLGRGILMLNHGAADRALPDFAKAMELAPKLTAARYNRGLAYLRLGRNDLAEADFTAVIGRNPKDAGAYLNRGRARMAQGRRGARNDFDRAIALAPEWPAAWFARGQLFDRQGKTDAANADFLRAYQLGMSDPWLIERVQKMSGQ